MKQLVHCANMFRAFPVLATTSALDVSDCAVKPASPSLELNPAWLTAIQNLALAILKFQFPRSKKTLVVLILAICQFAGVASATTHYIAATGGSDSNAGTSAAPWATFDHAWTSMGPGDTLIVGNGTYNQQVSPPASLSGTAGGYTTIQAETPWGVTVDGSTVTPQYRGTLYMYGMSYFQVIGIKFASGPSLAGGQEPIMLDTTDHIKLQKVAGYNAPCNNNTAVVDVTNSSYVLVEDSHAWGCGRYKFLSYQSHNIIFRHNVARHDSASPVGDTWSRQCAQFTMYDSTNIIWQNDISVDSGELDGSTGNLYGGVWSENNAGVDNSGEYEGMIFINLKTGTNSSIEFGASINDQKLIGTRVMSNIAIINSIAGIWTDRTDSTSNPANLLVNHITAVNLTGSNPGSANGADGVGAVEISNTNFTQEVAENSILQHDNAYGLAGYFASDYNIYYNNSANFGSSFSSHTPTAGAHDKINVDPLLKYPVRVEAGTPGSGAASDGGDIGATILYRLGTPGTLYGDAGYDTLTTIPLWPWDDEAAIKTDMAAYNGAGDPGVRGFTVPGNGLYGGPITLTSYIWESLGNPCPADVCTTGTGTTPTAAAPTFSPAPGTYSSTQSVSISDTTAGAAIYYTTDGSTPTTSSAVYSGPITVSSTETVEAIAVATGYSDSSVATALYTISAAAAATPTFSPAAGTYTSAQTVAIGSTTPSATIYYTTNGATPTTSSAVFSGPITVSATETLKAIAVASGFSNSAVATAAYTINQTQAATPTFTPAAGTYTSAQTVAISSATPSSTIYYTTNGATPTTSSAVFSGPITVSATETLKAIAVASGFSDSAVATAAYTINQTQAATPTFTPVAGTYTSAQTVTIGSATPSSTIYYTTNGATPTTSSAALSGPITVSATETLKAIAVASGFSDSAVATAAYTINATQAATPTFTPAAGTYSSAQSVTISSATPSSIIYYTTNGATPTTSSAALSGPITVSATETLKAIAVASGFSDSAVATAAYTINATQAATPTFTPAAGTYSSAQSVTISSATPSSIIYYTTNGATPTTSSAVFSGPITVSATETLKAIAVASGFSNSAVATATYTITLAQAAAPTFGPAAGAFTSAQSVAISSATPSATIYYTTNGTTPTTSSAVFSGPITVSATETLKAIAVASGFSNSAVATAAYTINLAQAAAPTFGPAAGAFTSAQSVAISSATPSATIYYTTNGTTPTTSSVVYSGPIPVSASETIEAIATASGFSNSAVATAAYSINSISQVATPAFTPAPGTYTSAQSVAISSATPSVTIYYTTNGSTPTTSSAVYSGPIAVSSSETIEAIATASGFSNSSVASAAYVINAAATSLAASPTFSPGAGTYSSAQAVSISSATPSATIYYTTNGTTPTTSSTVYSGPIAVSSSETIEAIATASGFSNSPVAIAAYLINVATTSQTASPTFTPGAGAYASAQSVTIASATPSATIYYTTNGTTPTTSSAVYSGPITVSSNETLEAIATASGSTNSAVSTAAYTVNAAATSQAASPTFSPAAGAYASAQTVSISSATPSATIYYTTNGTTPTTSSAVYSGPVTVSSTETFEAIAAASGSIDSAVATASYTINQVAGDFAVSSSPNSLTVTSAQPATATISVLPVNGFNSAVSLTCTGLPAGASCIFSQPTVAAAGAPASTTLTVSMTGTTTTLATNRNSSPLFPGSVLAVALCCISWKKRRCLQMLLLLVISVVGLTLLNGCGGATFVSNASHATVVSPITVTGTSGALQHSTTITVTMK